jgi:subtilisin-like proprotein convertase family protein
VRVSGNVSGAGVGQASPAAAIPDASSTGVTSTVTFSASGTVETVQVYVNVTHADTSQLIVTLTSPEGTTVTLHGLAAGTDIAGIYGNGLTATGLLSAFAGEDLLGIWKLKVVDASSGTTGTLNAWRLILNH